MGAIRINEFIPIDKGHVDCKEVRYNHLLHFSSKEMMSCMQREASSIEATLINEW
jgi:hypothetical protein